MVSNNKRENMRKLTFIAAAVSIALLGGCQQTPEQSSTPVVQVQPVKVK
jgi:hypothetical protein